MQGVDLVFLAVGVAVVIVVGRFLARSGRRFVEDGQQAGKGAASEAILFSVIFHLVTLGLVVLITVVPIGGNDFQRFMLRLGILLVVLGGAYAITLRALARRRDAALAETALNRWHSTAADGDADPASTMPPPQDPSAGAPPGRPDAIRDY